VSLGSKGEEKMFKRLENKMKSILLLFISLFVIFSFVIIYIIIKNNIFNNIIEFSLQNIAQRDQNVELYMEYMEETTKLVSTNYKILDELRNNVESEIIGTKLDYLQTTSLDILGITVYDNYGRTYATRKQDTAPDIEQILKNAGDSEKDKLSLWIYRNSDVSELISNPEVQKYGVFTYLSKIIDDDGIFLGYIMVDTKVQTLYNYYVTNTGELFRNTDTYILSKDNIMSAAPYNSQNYEPRIELIKKISSKNGYMLVASKKRILTVSYLKDSTDVIIVCTPTNISDQLLILNIAFISIVVILIATAFFGVTLISDSIIKPLTGLYTKMNNQHTGTLD
jgi:hypothetical protein